MYCSWLAYYFLPDNFLSIQNLNHCLILSMELWKTLEYVMLIWVKNIWRVVVTPDYSSAKKYKPINKLLNWICKLLVAANVHFFIWQSCQRLSYQYLLSERRLGRSSLPNLLFAICCSLEQLRFLKSTFIALRFGNE
jgi:hypothetical protein